jgi:hypothetical protein
MRRKAITSILVSNRNNDNKNNNSIRSGAIASFDEKA